VDDSLNQEARMPEPTTVREALDFAVRTEELGAALYKRLAGRFSEDAELKQMFEVLAEDEVAHGNHFRKLLELTPPDEGVSTGPEFQYLRAMSLSQFFLGEKGLKKKFAEIQSRTDALGIVFEFEKATLQYYQALREVLGENQALDAIIQAEKAHVMKIMQYIITDARFRGLADA
jgi:rubrerythrin